jgi:biotin carboxyl carrier protein
VSEVFFGDYSGIAASGGRVYGIWTEQPAVASEPENKPAADEKSSAEKKTDGKVQTEPEAKPEAKKDEKADSVKAPPKRRGTVVKVGVADFKDLAAPTAPH